MDTYDDDWLLVPVANHDPRLILVSGARDDGNGKLWTEEQPITGWLTITAKKGWKTSCIPITIMEPVMQSEDIVLNTETEMWYEVSGDQRSGEGRKSMITYLQELTKGLLAVK